MDDAELWDRKAEHIRDWAPEDVFVCSWCDCEIDSFDVDAEAFEVGDGPTCKECAEALNNRVRHGRRA
jgi:hypothetical protein